VTESQIHDAIRQMIVHCDLRMEQGDYPMMSARSTLYELGFEGEACEEIIRHIAEGGFTYCLDHTIPMTGHHDAQGERPHRDVCYWGPDQLASRLRCLSNVPYQVRAR
jgi:hypothetical protein